MPDIFRLPIVLNGAIDHILAALESGLSDKLVYHSLQHTLDVIDASASIAPREGVNGRDLELLLTAAAFHDCGFLRTYQYHEAAGCEIAAGILPDHGFSSQEIERIKGMIMATQIPQSPSNLLECILCDADLMYLGSGNYQPIADGLWQELNQNGMQLDQAGWLDMQIKFLQNHNYWTQTAVADLAPGKEKVLENLLATEQS